MASLMATTPDTGDTGDDNGHDDFDDDVEHDHDDGNHQMFALILITMIIPLRILTTRCSTGWQHPGRRRREPKEEKCRGKHSEECQ